MKTIRFILTAVLLGLAPVLCSAAGADGTRVHAIMIVASNEKGKSDPKLAPYEANLRRILRFESYRVVAEGSAAVRRGGQATLALTRGYRVELSGEGDSVHASWFEGTRKIIALALPPGKPSVLGGPQWSDKGEVCAVILIAD